MSYKVTNVKEIYYMGMSAEERKGIYRLNDLRVQQLCTCFGDGDYFALYKDADVKYAESIDDRTYAVYMHNSGELICLLVDADSALNGCANAQYFVERAKLYKQIAMLAGWPEKLPAKKRYTVRINRIMDIEVHADNEEQARVIGRKLAFYANHVGTPYGNQIHNAMADCEYEFADAWDAPADEDGVWDMVLDEHECEQLLNNKED